MEKIVPDAKWRVALLIFNGAWASTVYGGSEIKVALNGGLAYEGSNPGGSVPTLLHTASFTSDSESFPFFGRAKDMRYYDEVLSNEELIELTLRN